MKVDDSKKNIKVVVRVRPLNRREREQSQRIVVRVEDATNLLFDPDEDEDEFFFHGAKQMNRDITKRINKKLTMEFDEIFGNEATNQDIFESAMKPLVDSVVAGYNCSVFVYGATGAGKTYTMLGNDDNPGITYLTVHHLFEQITALSADRKFDIGISYLEVYNEQVMNLLTKSGPLKLREDNHGVIVGGLTLKPIHNAEEMLSLLTLGNKNRTQHPTDSNEESSRSHAIFQVHIRMVNKMTSQKNTVKLSMIDLAGSERAASTKGIGIRFKEGANINKSLLALGNCINKLADGSKHIPYRDSNLTRIIKDSLGGNCQTLMVANVSPSSLTYEDTYNTLKYASRAKKIRTSLKVNLCKVSLSKEIMFKKLTDQQCENERLQQKVRELELQLQSTLARERQHQQHHITQVDHREIVLSKIPDILRWYERIDAAFITIKYIVEQYYSMISKEKLLKFRIKTNSNAEEMRQILLLDDVDGSKSFNRLEASVDKMGLQVDRYKQETARLMAELYEKETDIKKLRKEIQKTEFVAILLPYLSLKENELDAVKAHVKSVHGMKINTIYQAEHEHYIKERQSCFSILQNNYLLLRATNNMPNELKDQFENLKKQINRRRGVTFNDERVECTGEDLVNLSINHTATELNKTVSLFKRPFSECDMEVDDSLQTMKHNFKKPSRKLFKDDNTVLVPSLSPSPMNLNETRVFSSSVSDSSESSLSNFSTKSSTVGSIRVHTMNGKLKTKPALLKKAVLTENNSNNLLYNRVLKINKPKLPTKQQTLNINKENKKFSPIRFKLSPKPKTPRVLHNRARHHMPSTSSSSSAENILNSVKKKF